MAKDTMNLEVLSTRMGFNSAVRHIKKTISINEKVGMNINLGDILYESGDEGLSGDRAGVLLRMLLVDKLGYKTVSSNLSSVVSDFAPLVEEFSKWNAVDLIAAYHHPDLGLLVANPKKLEELVTFGALRKRELLVIYAGKGSQAADELCVKAALAASALFEGNKPKIPQEFYKGNLTVQKLKKAEPPAPPAPAKRGPKPKASPGRKKADAVPPAKPRESARVAAPVVTSTVPAVQTTGPVRMTPMYSVVVQNELFHNGNVEAWKRIVASYNAKYPALQVYIYYEGERIMDINALFKWGKVKHGSSIQFAVAGNDIKDVAKLQRYLAQGASSQFEAFLRGPVNNVLKLF
ncbi:MAG: hypothetical protein LBK83_05405 [Treponema sp.]|jgi:hypothetical protein|nr:hypothetical protein [Treponema sp.]